MLYYIILYFIILYFIILYYIILFHIILCYYIIYIYLLFYNIILYSTICLFDAAHSLRMYNNLYHKMIPRQDWGPDNLQISSLLAV